MKKNFLDSISPFSLVLVMVILMIIGVAMIPLLKISYMPSARGDNNSLSVSFSWSGASARVIEQEITSKIEGLVSSVNGIEEVTSLSMNGSGSVSAKIKKGANVPSVRFEISSLLKQITPRLPEGVGAPSLSDNSRGGAGSKATTQTLLSYQVNADMDEALIENYAEKNIKPYIEQIDGVTSVDISGATPKYIEMTYDPILLNSYGISVSNISEGIRNFIGNDNIVGDVERVDKTGEKSRITVHLSTSKLESDIAKIPIGKSGDRTLYLSDVVSIQYKDRVPQSYYRINGLKTIYFSINVDADANLITMSDKLQTRMEEIKKNLANNFYVTLTNDAAKEIKTELYKLLRRTILSLLILLTFVWLVNRNFRYLVIIAITLLANILISFILYYTFDIELHIYSLAGIAVSFGLIIDTSIVMVDHYGYYRNRKVFLAILAAILTTIGSLIIIFFMPDYIKRDLYEFSSIIIVNLSAALLISLLFVPAIITKLGFSSRETRRRISIRRRIVKLSRKYARYITFTQKRKWIYIVIFILAFGIPVQLLPPKIGVAKNWWEKEEIKQEWYHKAYNNTIGSNFYQSKLKKPLEYTLGGTMRLFSSSLSSRGFSRAEQAPVLTISAKMPEGSSIGQLNDVIMQMENFLSEHKEISKYEARVGSDGGTIKVEFKEEYQKTSFPQYLSNLSKSQAISIGGADWSIFGIDQQGFSNALNLDHKSHRISISGYNYDRLNKYAEQLVNKMKLNKRVSDVDIEVNNGGGYSGRGGNNISEMYVKYDMERVALYNINLGACYNALSEMLITQDVGTYITADRRIGMTLISSYRDKFDAWNFMNGYLTVGDKQVRYSHIGEVGKRTAKTSISKKNQEYSTDIAFNFMGSYELSDRFVNKSIEEMNSILPIGFKCSNSSSGWYDDRGSQYWLILLIVVIIFFMCTILFESLRQPLVIISLIPLSFIGTFLTFYFSGINFGTGGFASLVLLSGLVVNAAIYVINEYNNYMRDYRGTDKVRMYIKSFNHKIIPVLLTVLSTVLGLIPFLLDGKEEQFWFSFAIGTSGGLLFSLFALVFILPILFPLKSHDRISL